MDVDTGFDFMPAAEERHVIQPLPALLMEDRGEDVATAKPNAAPHRADPNLRAFTIWNLSFGLGRGLHPQLIQQSWRDRGRPLGGERPVVDLNPPAKTPDSPG